MHIIKYNRNATKTHNTMYIMFIFLPLLVCTYHNVCNSSDIYRRFLTRRRIGYNDNPRTSYNSNKDKYRLDFHNICHPGLQLQLLFLAFFVSSFKNLFIICNVHCVASLCLREHVSHTLQHIHARLLFDSSSHALRSAFEYCLNIFSVGLLILVPSTYKRRTFFACGLL